MPELIDIRTLCSEYLHKKPGQSFEICDDSMPDTKTTIELSHFNFGQNPEITVNLSNFPISFPDGTKCNIWTFFSTAFVDTDLNVADFQLVKRRCKNKSESEILHQLTNLWNAKSNKNQ